MRKDLVEEDVVGNASAVKLLIEDLEEKSIEVHELRARVKEAERERTELAVLRERSQASTLENRLSSIAGGLGGVLLGLAPTIQPAVPAGVTVTVCVIGAIMLAWPIVVWWNRVPNP